STQWLLTKVPTISVLGCVLNRPAGRINRRGAAVVQFYEIVLVGCARVATAAIYLADQDRAGARWLRRRTVARRMRTGGSLIIRRSVTSSAGTVGTTPERAVRNSFRDPGRGCVQ